MIEFLRQFVRAKRAGKSMPSLFTLCLEYPKWRYFQRNFDVYKNSIPWITFGAIKYLKAFLKDDMKVFEYGGGGSTIFFANRVRELVTVEHNKEWFEGLEKEMSHRTGIKWKANLILPQKIESTFGLRKETPGDYFSDDENFNQYVFKKYASAIDEFPDEYFDVVLIDGRARPSCMFHSLAKVKKGGLLVLDNADRGYYLLAFDGLLDDYKLITNYSGPSPYGPWFTQTNIWKRVM